MAPHFGISIALVIAMLSPGPSSRDGSDPALAARIHRLAEVVFSDESGRTGEEVRKIFADRGVPTTAMVGVEAAEDFAVLAANEPLAFTKEVLAAGERIPSQVPANALAFLRARVKQKQIEASIREPYANPELAARLERLFVDDQAVRQRAQFDAARMREVDERTGVEIRQIFKRFGVPTRAMVGPERARRFVVLVQHQPPDLRREVLPKLKANVDRGEADPADYALMFDRARVDEGKPQRYGANFACAPDGTLAPSPIENPAQLDARRAEIGLLPMRLYSRLLLQTMPKEFCAKVTARPGGAEGGEAGGANAPPPRGAKPPRT
jgi:hypothetical protein